MTLVFAAAIVLFIGAGLALLPLNNSARAAVSLTSQGVACVLVLIAVLPILFGAPALRAEFAWTYPIGTIDAGIDALSAFFLSWSLPMTWLGTLYAVGYLRPYFRKRNAGVQFALLNTTSLTFVMIYTLENATAFLFGWEIAAVAAWLLVIWEYRNQKIRFAGFNYLVSTHVGFFFLVAAFMVMHSQTDSMTFSAFAGFLQTPSPMRNITFLLLVTSFGLKSAFFPFHTWLPRAHSAAPAHVSALMSGVIHKAGLFALLRFTLLIGQPEPWMAWYLLFFSAISAIIGVLYTTAQRDLKRLLGYSSTENVSIAGIGFGVGYLGLCWHEPLLVVLGFSGGILHILNHALFKCLLFYAAGSVYHSTHTVDLERLGGLAQIMPWTTSFFLLGSVAISALPPLNGFVSEFIIYAGLLSNSVPAGVQQMLLVCVAALLAFIGGISALSMTRAFGLAFLGLARDPGVQVHNDASPTMRVTMAIHAAGAVLIGFLPELALGLVAKPVALFSNLIGHPSNDEFSQALQLLTPVTKMTGLLLTVIATLTALRWLLLRSAPLTKHITWGCGYTKTSPRMQYTGTSFAVQFTSLFQGVLLHLRREAPPEAPFPENNSHFNTHCVDIIERRLFESLGEGEEIAAKVVARISEEPRFAFALGLIVLGILAGGAVLGSLK